MDRTTKVIVGSMLLMVALTVAPFVWMAFVDIFAPPPELADESVGMRYFVFVFFFGWAIFCLLMVPIGLVLGRAIGSGISWLNRL